MPLPGEPDAAEPPGAPVGLATVELDEAGGPRITHVSEAMALLVGRPADTIVGTDPAGVLGAGQWSTLRHGLHGNLGRIEMVLPTGGGRSTQVLVHWTVQHHGRDQGARRTLLLAVEEVGLRLRLERSLRHLALHDPLTGLPNRTLLLEHLDRALHEVHRTGRAVAVVYLDVDDLKAVNEGLGHVAGDDLLIAVGHRLRRTLRGSDVAGRLSGDEFAVICAGIRDDRVATTVGDRILETLNDTCIVAGHQIEMRVSAGLATGWEWSDTAAAVLLNQADEALRRAKRAGKGQYVVFDEALDREVRERRIVDGELRHAPGAGELRLYYQPVVRLVDGRITGAEALIRWQHPRRGLLEPAAFLTIAEESGSIIALGDWVLAEVCSQASRWTSDMAAPFTLSVNVSARQLGRGELVSALERCLRDHAIEPGNLRVEVTETMLTESTAARRELWDLDHLGIAVGIDDFGTGYASMTYLQQLPVHFLKIDRSFVAEMMRDPTHHAIVSAVINLARALGIAVVAEGVESRQQAASLIELGCPAGQGFLYSQPVTASELLRLIDAGPLPV